MFYYLGRKKRLAGLYPEPRFDTIIEPFAGSAAYSLHGLRWKKRVIVNDSNPDTIGVWRYLQQASVDDIRNLPDLQYQDRISDIKWLCDAERWLISYHINPGANQRSDVVQKFSRWAAGKRYIIENLHKIKHWEIQLGDYAQIDNQEATWFVDPPYIKTAAYYMSIGALDYPSLSGWCLSRHGQLIACEAQGADWLPFQPLATIHIAGKSVSREAVYIGGEFNPIPPQT